MACGARVLLAAAIAGGAELVSGAVGPTPTGVSAAAAFEVVGPVAPAAAAE